MICINASNLHVGGGVQVAASFINELFLSDLDYQIFCVVSVEVSNVLYYQKKPDNINIFVLDANGPLDTFKKTFLFRRFFKQYRITTVFSVFGPTYLLVPKNIKHIVGFANAWILFPKSKAYSLMGVKSRILKRFRYFIYELDFLFNSDELVVETKTVAKELSNTLFLAKKKNYVVENCVSSIYESKELWKVIDYERPVVDLVFCTIANDYIHKNLDIIPQVARVLRDKYNLTTQFIVTLKPESYEKKTSDFKSCTFNLGVILPSQCPYIYLASDAVFLPSLLECYSANYPEAIFMEKLIFTSNLPFAHEACGDSAFYFDPLDPNDIAKVIFENYTAVFRKPDNPNLVLQTAHHRMMQYINIIQGAYS
ncbi:hypothetical protein AT00_17125 [Pseudoalteromonas lipolytica SCSIO 04301]|uniref:glycosyltransferase family 1 protein n=1 Tax=Pseudoalteromonas lipolytica TaxID=570156 RepID=UPI00044595F7|nr:glycosyltransferase family 1 protein [Pseudoalteromonas lipolytica]EWH04884.1 hypothetical protein AT00_17125 [Pseudoalteromonas lipolytica SCSIO 04301]